MEDTIITLETAGLAKDESSIYTVKNSIISVENCQDLLDMTS